MSQNEAIPASVDESVPDSILKIIEKKLTEKTKWQPNVVEDIFTTELLPSEFATRKLALLASHQYLEQHLWPHFDENASVNNIVSICLMATEKMKHNMTWEILEEDTQKFSTLFQRVTQLLITDDLSVICQRELFTFLTYCFQSPENTIIRAEYLKFVTVGIWANLISDVKRENLFAEYTSLQKLWNSSNKKLNSAGIFNIPLCF
ncbi:hypothetical protein BY458DRAFT_445714 [Sporodiniella umbellata]|nr:hypothetical protein BY458DRAFT_445714 [Sporodiniella umbellata]